MSKKKITYIIFGCVLSLIMLVSYIFIFNKLTQEELVMSNFDFKILADSYDTTGVDLNSGFIITATEDYDLANVKDVVKVSPDIEYDLSKKGFGSYYLKPKYNLEDNSIFNIYISTNENIPANSWAFQTKAQFNILSSLPANNSVTSILNTGIQIDFSKKVNDIDEYFSIEPEIKGEFIYIGKSATFVPSKDLKSNEEYTVVIRAGLKSIDGDVLKNDYAFSFRTQENVYSSNNIFLTNKTQTFNTQNNQLIALRYGQNNYNGVEFNVNVYDLTTEKNYLELSKEEEIIDTAKYSLAQTFTSKVFYPEDDYSNNAYISYPENLPVGWYLIDITTAKGDDATSNQHLQQLVQVSDISVYMQSMNGEALIWCNDCTTSLPLANIKIKVGNESVKTNENGIAIIKTSGKQDVIIEAEDGKKFAQNMNFDADWEETKYNIYLFTDRESYQPTDTINFWGMIVAQNSNYKLPKELEVYLDDELVAKNITVNSNGIFTGKFEIENHISEYASLNAKFDDKTYYLGYIVIEEYTKPAYILDFEFDKEYYRRNEIANIDIKGSYFDGNPASNLDLNFTISSTTESIQLNMDGKDQIKYVLNNLNSTTWYPQIVYASLYTSGADEHTFTDKALRYFPTDYMIDSKVENNQLIISSNKIDYNKVDISNIDHEKIKGLPQSGVYGQINIYRNTYIKTQIGTYYDFINKVNKPKYSYRTDKRLEDTISFSTDANGKFVFPLNYEPLEESYYTYEITYNMPDYFVGKESGSINTYYPNNSNEEYYYFSSEHKSLRTNENILISIESNNTFENKGRVLYVVQNDKIQDANVTEDNEFIINYKEQYIPDVLILGAYFDGSNVHAINSKYLNYDVTEKELKIEVSTDKESYEPGDTVTIDVEAKDINNKTEKTNMVIAVVDEAAFAVNDQSEYPLYDLYSFDYFNPITYFSYTPFRDDLAGGEGGGDGEGTYRDYFKDTVAFLTIKTGSNGKTSASFTLPDNITSWRITTIGITDNHKAGVNKTNIISTLPFYANVVMNSKYNIGDDISLSLKTAGEHMALLSNSVQYTVNLIKNDEIVTSEVKYQLPAKSVNVNMGKVSEPGEYKLEIKAVCGAYKDTIVKEFSVVNSLHEINISRDIELTNLNDINAVKYPITLNIYDIDNKKYYDIVSKIFDTSSGVTIDQKIAYNTLVKRLNEINEDNQLKEIEIKNIQDYDGGIKLVEYGSSNPLITAKICAIEPDVLDQYRVIRYFENILANKESTSAEVSAAYFGLAALKEPVLNDIKYLLQNNKGFTLEDNLNLIAGLAYIGDNGGANEWYSNIVKSKVKTTEEDKYLYSKDDYKTYANTSLLAMILAKLNHEDFNMVSNYVVNTTSKEYTPAIDLVAYVKEYNPQTDSTGFIKYIYNGEEVINDFKDNRVLTLNLSERELKKTSILEANNVAANIQYVGTIDEAIENYENNIQITKNITDENEVGDMRTVTLTVKIPSGLSDNDYFVINDIVPNGMRFVGVEDFYSYTKDAQKIRFYLYNDKKQKEYKIKYNIRNVLEGEYVVESAIISNPETREIGFTKEEIIII